MKRFLCIITALIILAAAFSFTVSASSSDILTFSYNDTSLTATVKKCPTSVLEIEIPKTVSKDGKTYTVTTIQAHAFQNCSSLKKIIIPNTITDIKTGAFSTCTSLVSITLPDSVTKINDQIFWMCKSLKYVVIPDSVTSIGFQVFYGCDALEEINISAFVTSIDNHAFSNCPSLSKINVDKNNKYYSASDGVLFNKSKTTLIRCAGGNTGKYVVPDSVTLIKDGAFENCKLTSVTLGCNVKTIEEYTFASSLHLTSIVLQNSVKSIWEGAFWNCNSLKNVYYTGSKSSKANIYIEEILENSNKILKDAIWHYNCIVYDGHVFDNQLDATCNTCDFIKQCTEHIYESLCDSTCNICDYIRIPPHSYNVKYNAKCHWQLCTICKNIVNKNTHIYNNSSDTDCNTCGYIRQLTEHKYDNDYDTDCNECGQTRTVLTPEITSVSVVLGNSLTYNVKVSGVVDSANARLEFTVGSKTYTVNNYTEQDGMYVFTLKNIAPHLMTEDITAKLVVSVDSNVFFEKTYTTSLEKYCLSVAEQNSSYKDIVNAVLNYGAAAQNYKNYKTDVLANKTLSESEKVIDKKDYFDGLDKEYFTISNSLADWKSAGVYLDSKARIKLSFETEQDLKGISVLVENEWFKKIAGLENCIIKENGRYVFYFDGFNIDELDTIFLFTLCKDGKPISDTLSYSVESYAYRADSTDDSNLKNLMSALMNYGSVAKNY